MMSEYKLLIGAVVLIFIIGLKDDLLPLKPWQKLASQLIPFAVILFAPNGLISSFYGLFGIEDLPVLVGFPLTLFTIIVIVNSINLIDGADGLAGTLGLYLIGLLGIWFYLIGRQDLTIISMSFSGALFAFLLYNWQPAKVFMGDTGALVIGLISSYLIIQFLNVNYALPSDAPFKVNGITISLCLIFIPLFDTLRIFTIRIINGISPFSADKNHIHHIMRSLGLSHSQLTVVLAFLNLLFLGIALSLSNLSEGYSLLFLIILGLLLNFVIEYLINRIVNSPQQFDKPKVLKLIKTKTEEESKAS